MILTRVVKNLLIANILIFILLLFNQISSVESLVLYPMWSSDFGLHQFFTYMFLHASFSHVILNMLGLITFGPELEQYFGEKKFLLFYFTCGILGGLLHITFSTLPVLGASAAVWGLMLTYALLYPNRILHIYFLLPVKAKYIIGTFFLIEVMSAIGNSMDGVSHYGHVGGAVAGALFYFFDKQKNSL